MIFLAACASCVVAFLLSSALNWFALIPWRRSAAAHWTERARRLYPTRKSMLINSWLLGIFAGVAFHSVRGGAAVAALPAGLAAWLGASLSGYLTDRRIWPGLSFKVWARQFTVYAMFLQGAILVLAIGVTVMPPHFGWQTWLIAGATASLLLWLICGLILKILCRLRLVEPAPARARDIAARAAEKAGVRLRHAWITGGPTAQAFALLPSKDMLFSESLLQVLTDEELESVCTHEAGHLTESKWVFGGRMIAILVVSFLTLIIPVSNRFGALGVLVLLLAVVAVILVPLRLARRMEKRADAIATRHTENPAAYARALEKGYELNAMPAAMPKRSVQPHPDLYDRMIAAGVTPSYERPKRPAKLSWTTMVLIIAFTLKLVIVAMMQELANVARTGEPASWTFSRPVDSAERISTNAP